MPICLRLLEHCMRRAASRAAWTAGNNIAIRTAMIAITTNNSISVKPKRRRSLVEKLLNTSPPGLFGFVLAMRVRLRTFDYEQNGPRWRGAIGARSRAVRFGRLSDSVSTAGL